MPPSATHRAQSGLTAELVWSEQLSFAASSGENAIVVDGDGAAGLSPMQCLAIGVASCLAIDVVAILKKGRHALEGLRTSFSGERTPDPPRRFVAIALQFHVVGQVPPEAVERAIQLSRDTYCSAWNSLRQDVGLTMTFTLNGGPERGVHP
ncbi:MAG: OsmC family protein [Vicinamibacterales bacterium]